MSNTADGSVVSTVTDLCAYGRMVLAGGRGPSGTLLEPAGFERWIGPYVDADERDTRYGYGWDVIAGDGRRLIRHTGGTVGFTALLAIAPEDGLAVAICLNGDGVREALGAYALRAVSAAVRGDDLPDPVAPEPAERVEDPSSLTGRYVADGRAIELDAVGDGLVVRAGPLAVSLERWPDEPDTFAVPHPAFDRYLLRVVRSGTGAILGLSHGPAWFGRDGEPEVAIPVDASGDAYTGLYRADAPWVGAIRVYERRGRLYALWPSDGEEVELTSLPDGWFAAGDPHLPRRIRFLDVVEARAQTLEYNGAVLTRSFEG